MLNKTFYCSLSTFYAILNRVLSKISNIQITVFSITRSKNDHILSNVWVMFSFGPWNVHALWTEKSYLHFRRLSTKLYCSVSCFYEILNGVLSKLPNIWITVFSFARSKNVHILSNICILSSVEPKMWILSKT